MKSGSVVLFCLLGIFLGISIVWPQGPASPAVTTESLFLEMADFERLTRFPLPAYRTVQYSSFDRRSSLPGGPGWFANSDGFGGEPGPNFEKVLKEPGADGIGEYLVADLKGPGAVVRLWTAAIAGRVRVYIDDTTRPLYEGPAETFFRRTYDVFPEATALDRSLLEKAVYQRDAAYAPLPFRRRLKVVWIGNLEEIHFYQLGVRLYEPGTAVVSFRPGDLGASASRINQVMAVLADPDADPPSAPAGSRVRFQVSIPPFEKKELLSAEGPKAVASFSIRLSAEDMDRALRETILHVLCDDVPWGQVQAPVGDFFGAAPGINPYVSLPFSVRPDGTMVCRFRMPFRESMRILLESARGLSVNAEGEAVLSPYAWDDGRSMHFRALWRADHGLVASNRDVQDLPFIMARGRGLYVGTTSYLMNPSPIPTPYGSWWGEGDEKIFVDGDRVPSAFGTGSEDYYNYSWSVPDIFAFPYCGQPRNDGPGNRGFVTNFRWHILDPLPFRENLAFYMELYSHERTPGLSYARIGYHYARPGTYDDHRPISPDDIRELVPPAWEPASRMGARDTEFTAAEKAAADSENSILRGGRLYAGDAALVWLPGKAGETKNFKVTVAEAGRKRIHFAFVRGEYSGTVSVLLDGRAVPWAGGDDTLDLRAPGRTIIRMYGLDPMDIDAGEHVLTLKFVGAAPDIMRPEIGLDFIGIQKAARATAAHPAQGYRPELPSILGTNSHDRRPIQR